MKLVPITSFCGLLVLATLGAARADVLMGTNGERFVGTIVEETTNAVVFQSDLGGKLTIPRTRIREIQRSPPPLTDQQALITEHRLLTTNNSTPVATVPFTNTPSTLNSQPSTNLYWFPPAIGHDQADWVQLKSGEWLRGRLKYIQQKEVEFDSDELDELTLKLKNVRQIYPAEPMSVKFNDQAPIFGMIVVSNDVVSVSGAEQISLSRDDLIGITPAGVKGIRDWSGKASLGLGLQSGNRQLTTLTASGELARRTPNTSLVLDYLGNYSQVSGIQNANNQRVNGTFDLRLDRHWFVRAAQLEFYRDPIANISLRMDAGIAAGYYIYDRQGLTWLVFAGPSYQYTRFDTVEPGNPDTATTPAGVLGSSFKIDFTRRLDLDLSYRGVLTSPESGQYTHHAVATLSFEIKRHLNLDVSYVWDFLQRPQVQSDGSLPQRSDRYLTVGLGVRF